MSFSFTLSTDGRLAPPQLADVDVGGEDVSLAGGDMCVTANGDLGVVVAVAAARQSILRELPANPGSFARRQEWGGGLQGLLFKGATPAVREKIESRARTRLLANPRVTTVNNVSATLETAGLVLAVDVNVPSGRLVQDVVVKTPGVR